MVKYGQIKGLFKLGIKEIRHNNGGICVSKKQFVRKTVLSFVYVPQSAIAATKKVTVNTQKELNAALRNPSVTQIVIKTSKKLKLTIPDGDYTDKRLYLKAPSATIKLDGDEFKSIHTYVSTQTQLNKALKDGNIDYISINSNKKSTLTIPDGDYSDKGLYINAPEATVVNKGEFKTVTAYVSTQKEMDRVLKNSGVTNLCIITDTKEKFVINKDYPNLVVTVNAPKATFTATGDLGKVNVQDAKDVTLPEDKPTLQPTVTPEPTATVEPTKEPEDNSSTGGGAISLPSNPVINPDPVVPVNPAAPTNTTEPTATTVPTVAPTATPTPVDENVRNTYLSKIQNELTELRRYMQYYTDLQFDHIIAEIKEAKNNDELNSHYKNYCEEISNFKQASTAYKDKTAYNKNVISVDDLKTKYSKYLINDWKYQFDEFGKHYSVLKEEIENINSIILEDYPQSVTGGAFEFKIKAWNNINGADDLPEIVLIDYDDGNDTYTTEKVLERGVDYQITNDSIIFEPSAISKFSTVYNTILVKHQVSYLGSNGYIRIRISKFYTLPTVPTSEPTTSPTTTPSEPTIDTALQAAKTDAINQINTLSAQYYKTMPNMEYMVGFKII